MSIVAGRWTSRRLSVPSPFPSLGRETVRVGELAGGGRPGFSERAWLAPGQVRPAQASSTSARCAREQPAGGGRETGVVRGGAQLRAQPREPTELALRSPVSHRQAARLGRLLGPSSPSSAGRAPLSHGQPFQQPRGHGQAPRQGWPAEVGGGGRPSGGEEAEAGAGRRKRGEGGRGRRAASGQGRDRYPDRCRGRRRK